MDLRGISVGLLFALAAAPAFAQQAQSGNVAQLVDIVGNVLVSQGDAMVAGTEGQRIPLGTRVVTTAGANVRVNYDFGCDVRLKENERFTVNAGACAALLASVEPLGPAAGAIGGGTAGAAAGGVLASGTASILAAGAVIGIGVYETFRKPNVSPN